jgi:hypothetical protein
MKYRIVGLMVMGMLLGLAGCEKEGPAERAGKQIDETAEQAKESMQNAEKDVKEAAGDVADAAKEAEQEVKDDMKKD